MTLNAQIVDIAKCEKYTKGGLIRRLCSQACHKYDILCYDRCVNG
jgi:hypothetical protein